MTKRIDLDSLRRSHDRPLAQSREELDPLLDLCRDGRLFDVAAWVEAGRPIQLDPSVKVKGHKWRTPLFVALRSGQHALCQLLLCAGYDSTLEPRSPYLPACDAKRSDLVDLLFEHGVKPTLECLFYVLDTYETAIYERFLDAGLDFTRDHLLGRHLGEHSSNKPLFGFVKRHLGDHPELRTELNIALQEHLSEGSLRGVALCLWAGADPHARVSCSWYGEDEDDEDGTSGVESAVFHGNLKALEMMKLDPQRADFDRIYEHASDAGVVEYLQRVCPPKNIPKILEWVILNASYEFRSRTTSSLGSVIDALFASGARWTASGLDSVASVRRSLLRLDDRKLMDGVQALFEGGRCDQEILEELVRTPSIKKRLVVTSQDHGPPGSHPSWTPGSRGLAGLSKKS